jgi:hypothetical protein
MVGRKNVQNSLWWAALLPTLRTTAQGDCAQALKISDFLHLCILIIYSVNLETISKIKISSKIMRFRQ